MIRQQGINPSSCQYSDSVRDCESDCGDVPRVPADGKLSELQGVFQVEVLDRVCEPRDGQHTSGLLTLHQTCHIIQWHCAEAM